ncbi:acylneuraminate cytidylyltransferase family protein [Paramagnetospirillum kuznetsovii]|uniref:acylneuraminate cytidylyltransferase family protein n=1 Tax=Paramagnetospirillum kuznetsovii TaxID=2053833 RepID=UPI001EFCE370|nr:acylneuraminate cytidylyltransferase family protein [Paramagnetospirillum kuznetsovii]
MVPARGGSKGVLLKNIRALAGRPLIAWTADCIAQIPDIDRAVVSTDDESIAAAAMAAGLSAPFRRPAELSGDRVTDLPVLDHALRAMEALDATRYDVVVMLQPTSPLRLPGDVARTLVRLVEDDLDAVWTVSPTNDKYHPVKQLVLRNGLLDYWTPEGRAMPPRQLLEPVYHVNGIAYALTRSCILDQRSRLGQRTAAVIVEGCAISIDTLDDFAACEAELIRRGQA